MGAPLRERLLSKAVIDPGSGCWLWIASTNPSGYGQLMMRGGVNRPIAAHRLTYEMFIGPIPEGLQLDHLCRVRHCVNPWHLEAVTNRENTLRGQATEVNRARILAQTHCKYDHPFDESNTLVTAEGHRICRACQRTQARSSAGHGEQQRARGRRVRVAEWINSYLAIGECNHEIATSSGHKTQYAICRECAPEYHSDGPQDGAS